MEKNWGDTPSATLKKRKVEYVNPYFQLAKDLFYIEMEPPL